MVFGPLPHGPAAMGPAIVNSSDFPVMALMRRSVWATGLPGLCSRSILRGRDWMPVFLGCICKQSLALMKQCCS